VRERWEFPVYWYPSQIEAIPGGHRLSISMSFSKPPNKDDGLRLRRDPKTDDFVWWLAYWVEVYGGKAA